MTESRARDGKWFARPSLNNLENEKYPWGLEIGGQRIMVEWTHEAANYVSTKINAAHAEAVEKRVKEAVAQEREQNCEAIRAACSMCNGTGMVVVMTSEHACGGDEGKCLTMCPIPGQAQQDCEYCGRPIQAIRSRPPEGK